MKILTTNLNQAAFLVALGAKLVDIDRQPNSQWDFQLRAAPWMLWYEKHIGWMPYRKYHKVRTSLKRKYYNKYGRYLNSSFRGEREGQNFHDVIHVRAFTKSESQSLKL